MTIDQDYNIFDVEAQPQRHGACLSPSSSHPLAPSDRASVHPMLSLSTWDDGACGIHAVFGEPDSMGMFCRHDARNFAARCLQQAFELFERDEGQEGSAIRCVITSLWSELVLPSIQGTMYKGQPSIESRLVWFFVDSETKLRWVHHVEQEGIRLQQHELFDVELAWLLRKFCDRKNEQAVRSLGSLLGHLPTHSIEWPAATLHTEPCKAFENCDLLQTQFYSKIFNGKEILYIRGATDVRCPISSQHFRSKYEALFDNNLAFDGSHMFLCAFEKRASEACFGPQATCD